RRLQDGVGAEHVVVGQAEQLFPDAVAVAQTEVAHTADLVGRLAALDPALGDRRVPIRQAVEIAHARPDAVVARVDDGGHVDPGHGALRPLLARTALGGRLARGRWRSRLAFAAALARGVADALHVARFTNEARHLGEASALDANFRQDRVDQRRLYAVAQRRIDHLVGGAA